MVNLEVKDMGENNSGYLYCDNITKAVIKDHAEKLEVDQCQVVALVFRNIGYLDLVKYLDKERKERERR
jgi:hypothetical protein